MKSEPGRKLSAAELEELRERAIRAAKKNNCAGDRELTEIIEQLLSQFSEETQKEKLLKFFQLYK